MSDYNEVMFIQLCGKHGKGKWAIIDKEDFDKIKDYKWSFDQDSHAVTKTKVPHETSLRMHRLIMDAPKGMVVHHKNHDTLDNRKENLVICTQRQNSKHQFKRKGIHSSQYKGVSWSKTRKKWQCMIKCDYNPITLGLFEIEEDAAKCYDYNAIKLFGEFALLNFPEFDYSDYTPNPHVPEYYSNYRGATFHKRHQKWCAHIRVGDKTKHLGYFDNEIDAAKAWDKYSVDNNLGRRLNFPEDYQ